MKQLLIPAMLLAAASSFGALSSATGDRLTDYTNWFAPQFNVASDKNYTGVPYPRNGQPAAGSIDTVNRSWGGWKDNFVGSATELGGPIVAPTAVPPAIPFTTKVEFVFLGETAGWWDDIGYRLNGVDYTLASGIQAAGATPNRWFGDYVELTLNEGDVLDFYVVGKGSTGGKYYVFDQSLNNPVTASTQSYWGSIVPLTNTRAVGQYDLSNEAFTVMGFEDVRVGAGADRDYNDLLFAFRSSSFQVQGPVPEPSTYGLIGAAALLGLVGYRRFKKSKA